MGKLFRNLGPMGLRNRRVREKYCLMVILLSFCIVCVGMVFFLPDLRAKTKDSVHDVYQKLPDLFLAPHFPAPPAASLLGAEEQNSLDGHGLPRPLSPPISRNLEDREKLFARIREDEEQENKRLGILEKPKIVPVGGNGLATKSSSSSQLPSERSSNDNVLQVPADLKHKPIVAPSASQGLSNKSQLVIFGGEDLDERSRTRRDAIRQVQAFFRKHFHVLARL